MYFSKLCVRKDASPKELSQFSHKDGYKLHQWVWSLFPEDKEAKRDFLFHRFETPASPVPFGYFVVSRRPPQRAGDLWELSVKPYAPKLETGAMLKFSLRANVTIKSPHRDRAKTQGKREDLLMYKKHQWRTEQETKPEAEREPFPQRRMEQELGLGWLAQKGEANGFHLEAKASKVLAYRQEIFYGKAKQPVRYSYFDFDGTLAVTDPQKFEQCLFTGIGKAKGFGCGLLMVAPR